MVVSTLHLPASALRCAAEFDDLCVRLEHMASQSGGAPLIYVRETGDPPDEEGPGRVWREEGPGKGPDAAGWEMV